MKNIFFVMAIILSLSACADDTGVIVQTGLAAPTFTLPSQDGKDISLADYRGKWVVLYFYPKDFSGGCTIEAHNFQQDINKYHRLGAVIIGVSGDDVDSHKGFCAKQGLDFKLLSDTSHFVSEAYGTVMEKDGDTLSARSTFLIDPSGIVRKIYRNVNPANHSKDILADLKAFQKK